MGTYKTGWLRLPSDPNDFKERFAWSHVKSIFYDKAKNILLKKKLDDMDGLIADHADAIANKLMTNDAFNTAIADYVTKAMMSSTQVNDANHVPTSSLAYAMQQAITANANAITQLNSDLINTPQTPDIKAFCKSLSERQASCFLAQGSTYTGAQPDSTQQWVYEPGIAIRRWDVVYILWFSGTRNLAIGTYNVKTDTLTWNVK